MSDAHNAPRRIPDFSTREEEAEWWDTHSFTDYLDELEPVEVSYAKPLSSPLTVRLDSDDREALSRRAHDLGIGPSTLIRMWVKERLRAETNSRSR